MFGFLLFVSCHPIGAAPASIRGKKRAIKVEIDILLFSEMKLSATVFS